MSKNSCLFLYGDFLYTNGQDRMNIQYRPTFKEILKVGFVNTKELVSAIQVLKDGNTGSLLDAALVRSDFQIKFFGAYLIFNAAYFPI